MIKKRLRLNKWGPEQVMLAFIQAHGGTRQQVIDHAYNDKGYTKASCNLAFADLNRDGLIFKRDGLYKTGWTPEDIERRATDGVSHV